MLVLKSIGKILLVPVWLVVAIIWLIVKGIVVIYSFVRGFVAFVLGAMIVGTITFYQDWRQVTFLVCISGVTIVVLASGTMVEVLLETARAEIGKMILA